MKRHAFTMIELIFVIVILGILAATALPKFLKTSEQANASKVEAFVATANRTVLPSIWSAAVADSVKRGSIKDEDIKNYIDLISDLTIDLSTCGVNYTKVGEYKGLSNLETIYCKDGNTLETPKIAFSNLGSLKVINN